jgi:hypothetical protein
LIGRIDDPETLLLRRFLVRNAHPSRFIDAHNGESLEWTALDLPAIGLSDGRTLHRPLISILAEELGITALLDQETLYDVAVVGAGPSVFLIGAREFGWMRVSLRAFPTSVANVRRTSCIEILNFLLFPGAQRSAPELLCLDL